MDLRRAASNEILQSGPYRDSAVPARYAQARQGVAQCPEGGSDVFGGSNQIARFSSNADRSRAQAAAGCQVDFIVKQVDGEDGPRLS